MSVKKFYRFYTATVDSVLTLGMTCRDGSAPKRNKQTRQTETSRTEVGGERGRKHQHGGLSSTSDKQTEDNSG